MGRTIVAIKIRPINKPIYFPYNRHFLGWIKIAALYELSVSSYSLDYEGKDSKTTEDSSNDGAWI